MINEKTILSSFDDKETLLKWLKKTEQALDMSVLTSIEPIETSEGYFNLKFNFKDGTSIETPTAIQLKGYQGKQGDKGDKGDKGDPLNVVVIPSGTDILTFDFSPYGSGSLFIGNNLKGMPSEIDPNHSQVVIQLLRNNATLYCLKVYNTGLYSGKQGEYTTYHYAENYDGWKTTLTSDLYKTNSLFKEKILCNGINKNEKGKYCDYAVLDDGQVYLNFKQQPFSCRSQISFDYDLAKSAFENLQYNGLYSEVRGITNGSFILSIHPFKKDTFIEINLNFGTYTDFEFPYLEYLVTEKLPEGVTITSNTLNHSTTLQNVRIRVDNTISKSILVNVNVINSIAYIYITEAK